MILIAGNLVLFDKNLAILNVGQDEKSRYFPVKMKVPRVGGIIGSFKFYHNKFTMLEEIESFDIVTDHFVFIVQKEYEIIGNQKISIDGCPIPIKHNGNLSGPFCADMDDLFRLKDGKTTYYPHIVKLR